MDQAKENTKKKKKDSINCTNPLVEALDHFSIYFTKITSRWPFKILLQIPIKMRINAVPVMDQAKESGRKVSVGYTTPFLNTMSQFHLSLEQHQDSHLTNCLIFQPRKRKRRRQSIRSCIRVRPNKGKGGRERFNRLHHYSMSLELRTIYPFLSLKHHQGGHLRNFLEGQSNIE